MLNWSPRRNVWEEAKPKEIANLYTITAGLGSGMAHDSVRYATSNPFLLWWLLQIKKIPPVLKHSWHWRNSCSLFDHSLKLRCSRQEREIHTYWGHMGQDFIGRASFSHIPLTNYVVLLSSASATSFLLILQTTSPFTANSSVDART